MPWAPKVKCVRFLQDSGQKAYAESIKVESWEGYAWKTVFEFENVPHGRWVRIPHDIPGPVEELWKFPVFLFVFLFALLLFCCVFVLCPCLYYMYYRYDQRVLKEQYRLKKASDQKAIMDAR